MEALFVGGKYNRQVMSIEKVKTIGNGRYTKDLTELRNNGICVHREELDNQPLVDGYLSPMWDGGRLRYETQEVYDMFFD